MLKVPPTQDAFSAYVSQSRVLSWAEILSAYTAGMPDQILDALMDAVSADYEVLGELGRRDESIGFLARTWAGRILVVLLLSPGAQGAEEEYSLDVIDKLDARVPQPPQECLQCHTSLRPWARFCTRCGNDASGLAATGSLKPDDLRRLAERAAGEQYELLGEMARSGGGGAVYFGRDRATKKVAVLRLERGSDARVAVTSTQTLKTMETPVRSMPSDDVGRKKARVSLVLSSLSASVDEERGADQRSVSKAEPAEPAEPRIGLTRAEALALLGIDPAATPPEIRRRYEDMYSEYRVRETNAPTKALRMKYQTSLAAIEAAGIVLMGA